MNKPPKPSVLNDVSTPFIAEPTPTREQLLVWLKAELQKGLDSGVDPRPYQQIIDDIGFNLTLEADWIDQAKDQGLSSPPSKRSVTDIMAAQRAALG